MEITSDAPFQPSHWGARFVIGATDHCYEIRERVGVQTVVATYPLAPQAVFVVLNIIADALFAGLSGLVDIFMLVCLFWYRGTICRGVI